jgi:hypothetical protein
MHPLAAKLFHECFGMLLVSNPHERKALGSRRRGYHGMKAFRTDGRVFLVNHHRVGDCTGDRLRNDRRRNNVDK